MRLAQGVFFFDGRRREGREELWRWEQAVPGTADGNKQSVPGTADGNKQLVPGTAESTKTTIGTVGNDPRSRPMSEADTRSADNNTATGTRAAEATN